MQDEGDNDRVAQLELEVAEMKNREEDTRNKLNQILDFVSQLKPGNVAEPTPNPIIPDRLNVHETPLKARRAKPASPPEFDGDRAKGLVFLNSCQTYFRLCPEEFRDEQTKIIWAMSYMKVGRAAKWTARIFQWEQQPENTGYSRFVDWDDFREEFKKEFTPARADVLAINRLESAAYYQKARSLDDYLDEFQDLITESGYTDPKTIVVKFRRGLNSQIQNAVATMASGRPSDTSPAQWYEVARTVDQNRATNEAFQSSHRGPAPTPPRVLTTFPARSTQQHAPQRHAHLVPTPGNPIPMDIDATKRKALSTALCFRCGRSGHFAKDCPDRYDVRLLSVDELQSLLEDRFAQLDVTPVEPTRTEEEVDDQEDFQKGNE
jgi:hypothetical protein